MHLQSPRESKKNAESLGSLPLIRPQLSPTILLPTQTPHRTRINLRRSPTLARPGVIIEGELRHARDVTNCEEGQVVQPLVARGMRHGDHPAVGVTRVVHEPRRSAESLAVDDVDALRVIRRGVEVQPEQVRVSVLRRRDLFSDIGFVLGDHLSKVTVNELAGADGVGRSEALPQISFFSSFFSVSYKINEVREEMKGNKPNPLSPV